MQSTTTPTPTNPPATSGSPPFLTEPEAVALARVSRETLRMWAKKGYAIGRAKCGGRVLYDRRRLENFLSGGPLAT